MNGLARFDGYSFTHYVHKDSANSLVGNWIKAISEAADHAIWIGTKEGLSRFDPRLNTFTNYQNDPRTTNSLISNQINSLVFDSRGKLWIGTPDGLTVFNPATQSFKRFSAHPFSTRITKLLRAEGDQIWIATDEGPVKYNVQTNTFKLFPLSVQANPFGDRISSMLDVDHDLYIGTFLGGLFRLPFQKKTGEYGSIEPINSSVAGVKEKQASQIYDLCLSNAGTIWLATNNGIARIEHMDTRHPQLHYFRHNLTNGQSLSNNTVYKILVDQTNVLWCGTEDGLNKTDLELLPFTYYTFFNQQAQDEVRSLYSATGKTLWFGTVKSGLYTYDTQTNHTYHIKFGSSDSFLNAHRVIYPATNGGLWAGTLGGAIRLPMDDPVHPATPVNGMATYAFLTDNLKNVWVGTYNGLYRISPDGKMNRVPKQPTGKNFVRSLYQDHTGKIWVGYESSGLYWIDPQTGTFRRVTSTGQANNLVGNTIFTLLEYPKNVLWVGTEAGLNKIVLGTNGPGMIRTYEEKNGLPALAVNSLLADKQGNLWIGTIKGLARFDTGREQFQIYLRGSRFSYNGCSRLTNDNLLFGTSDGFVIFDPMAIHPVSSVPSVVLNELKILNKPVTTGQVVNADTVLTQAIDHTTFIRLNHHNNVFTLGFTALHFSNPAANTYAFKLEGFDKDWVYTNAQNRTATYTNLNPGTYRFLVKAANYLGQWSPKPAALQVMVLPAPWKSNGAIAGYLLLGSLVLILIIRYLLILSQQRQQLRFARREKEQQERLNQFKLQFFTDVSHEFRTPLSLISGPIEDLILSDEVRGTVRQKVEYVQRNTRKLLQLIDELMTFQKMDQDKLRLQLERVDLIPFVREVAANFEVLARQKGIDFRLVTEQDTLFAPIDPNKLDKVLNNLVANALKFTPGGGYVQLSVTVVSGETDVDYPGNWIRITVEDNGTGITKDEQTHLFERFFQSETIKGGTGVGLSLVKSLVELHKGQILVQSEPNECTRFTVLLPVLPTTDLAPVCTEPISLAVSSSASQWLPQKPLLMAADGASRANLLLVDDNLDVLSYLELTFQDQYTIRKAANGLEALRLIQQHEPDVIICDVSMPVMDGIELCRRLKTDVVTSHIPVLLLTARTAVESALSGLGAGADDYIAKPFHPGLLAVRVEKLIENRRLLIQKYQTTGLIIPEHITSNPLDQALLQRIIDSIMVNLDNDEFGVEALGEQVNMSRSNLFRKVKALTGQTPIEFIYDLRLKHSLSLLLERKLTISEITSAVGFKTRSSFTRSFRQQFGKAPTEYLNDLLAKQPQA